MGWTSVIRKREEGGEIPESLGRGEEGQDTVKI
jgi:hypothetical protein